MNSQVNRLGKIGFSSFVGGQKVVYVLISAYATIFYITKLGLNPAFVAALIFFTRMFDAVNDPFIGSMIDKYKVKYKVYLTIAALLLPLLTVLIFTVPPVYTKLYVVITYVLWSVLYTVGEVSIYSVVMKMTEDKDEQNSILSISQVGSMIGIFMGMGIIAFYLRNGVDNIAWVNFALSFAAIGFVQMMMAIFFVDEKYPKYGTDGNQSIFKSLKRTFSNKHLLTIMVIYLAQMFVNASSVMGVYVFDAYYGNASIGSIIGMFGVLLIIPLAFSISKYVKLFGKTNIMTFAAFVMIGSNLLILFSGANVLVLVIFSMLSTVGVVIPSILRPLYVQECINHEIERGRPVDEATYYSVMTFTNKTGDAIGASLGSLLVAVSGYTAGASVTAQLHSTIEFMRIVYFVGPMLMGFSIFVGINYFYKLSNPKSIDVLASQIDESTLNV